MIRTPSPGRLVVSWLRLVTSLGGFARWDEATKRTRGELKR